MRNSTLPAPRIKPSSQPIDVPLSELVGLSKAAKLLPPHDDGTPRGFHFTLRLVKRGHLRAVRVGRCLMTHPTWLAAAFEQLNTPNVIAPTGGRNTVSTIDTALDAEGL